MVLVILSCGGLISGLLLCALVYLWVVWDFVCLEFVFGVIVI